MDNIISNNTDMYDIFCRYNLFVSYSVLSSGVVKIIFNFDNKLGGWCV